jgi:uncharacterized protein (DUF433 family)
MKSSIIQIDADIQHGEPVFRNTRVPIKSLFDYISTGESLEVYLDDFPSVNKDMALNILKKAEFLFWKTYKLKNEEGFA